MARIPTADDLGFGQQKLERDPTPTQQPIQQDFGAQQAQNLKNVGNVVADVGKQALQAQKIVANREQTIQAARATMKFNRQAEKIYGEWAAQQNAENLDSDQPLPNSSETLMAFKKQLVSLSNQIVQEARVNPAFVQEDIDKTIYDFQTKASQEINATNKKLLYQSIGEKLNIITAQVRDNPNSLKDAIEQFNGIYDKRKGALTPLEENDFFGQAHDELLKSAVEGYTDVGNFEQANELFRDNQDVFKKLRPSQYAKINSLISNGLYGQQKTELQARQKIDTYEQITGQKATPAQIGHILGMPVEKKHSVEDAKQMAEAMGMNWDLMSPGEKTALVYNNAAYAALDSKETKLLYDRIRLVEKFGEDSLEVKQFKKMIENSPQNQPKILQLINARNRLKKQGLADDDPDIKAIDAEINKYDPWYKYKAELASTMVDARFAVDGAKREAESILKVINKAMALALGREVDSMSNDQLLKSIPDIKNMGLVEYLIAKANIPATVARDLQNTFNTIKARGVFKALKEVSLGQISNFEIQKLEESLGALDISLPASTWKNLLVMREAAMKIAGVAEEEFLLKFRPVLKENVTQKEQAEAVKLFMSKQGVEVGEDDDRDLDHEE